MTIQNNHKVTLEAKMAFDDNEPYKNGDTEILASEYKTVYMYYGHVIATKDFGAPNHLNEIRTYVQTCHLQDVGFRMRLNSLDNVNVLKSNGKYHLNGIEWNGKLARVFKGYDYV